MNASHILATVLFGTLLYACGDSNQRRFMKLCGENASKRACQCVYDDLENQYGKEQFAKLLDNDYRSIDLKTFQEKSLEAVYKCSGLDVR